MKKGKRSKRVLTPADVLKSLEIIGTQPRQSKFISKHLNSNYFSAARHHNIFLRKGGKTTGTRNDVFYYLRFPPSLKLAAKIILLGQEYGRKFYAHRMKKVRKVRKAKANSPKPIDQFGPHLRKLAKTVGNGLNSIANGPILSRAEHEEARLLVLQNGIARLIKSGAHVDLVHVEEYNELLGNKKKE